MSVGRPRASSREILAEAACELFLEQGFEATSVADITNRAGVSRSSFFNYFSSKSAVLWAGVDERIDGLAARLGEEEGDAATVAIAAVEASFVDFAPDSLALAIVNATAMGVADELEREASLRRARIGRLVARRLHAGGRDRISADVAAAAVAGAVIAAIEAWAHDGAGVTEFSRFLRRGLDAAAPALG